MSKRNELTAKAIITGVVILVASGIFAVVQSHPATEPPRPTIAPSKQIIESSLPLQEIWRWSGIVKPSQSMPNLVVIDDRIIVVGRKTSDEEIMVFDALTGKLIWKRKPLPRKGSQTSHFRSVNADNERIYIGTLDNVQAFDLETGQLLWTGAEQPWLKHGTLHVYPKGNQLEAYSYYDYLVYMLNASTGDLLEKNEYPDVIIKNGDIVFGEFRHNTIWAKDVENQQTLWKRDIGKLVQPWLIFVDDVMYFSAGAESGIDNRQIFALSSETGEIIWKTPEGFISNIALGKNTLYAIQGDATIVGLDPKTGQVQGQIKMSPPRTYQDDGNWKTAYTIAASDEFVAVHYYNSRELVVFRIIDEG